VEFAEAKFVAVAGIVCEGVGADDAYIMVVAALPLLDCFDKGSAKDDDGAVELCCIVVIVAAVLLL
jgi:hypothetical protein